MNQSWSIIVFGYNESATINRVVNSADEFLKKHSVTDREIIIIDDGSTDVTESKCREMIKNINGINYIRHNVNLGIGKTLLDGYLNAEKENVIAIPADGQFDISELSGYENFPENSFLSFFREEKNNYSLYRKIITGANQLINRNIFYLNIKDVNWVKAYKSADLKKLNLKLESSLLCTEICAKLNLMGVNAVEINSVYHERISGKTKAVSASAVFGAVKELNRLYKELKSFNK